MNTNAPTEALVTCIMPTANRRAFVARVNAAGGSARMLHLPEQGIHGNSHMIMQDRNNLRVADLLLKWIDESVGGKKARSQGRPGKSIRRQTG
jgi:hypothetical protein